jgi:hypothetical protein
VEVVVVPIYGVKVLVVLVVKLQFLVIPLMVVVVVQDEVVVG